MAPTTPTKTQSQSKLAPVDFKVDEKKTHKGECVYFNKRGGYGFIKPDASNVAPDDKVMVFWKELKTDDRWPYMHKGMKCEFKLSKFVPKSNNGAIIKARDVTAPGGKKVALLDELEEKFEYVHSRTTRFTGEVKFYNIGQGAGYVTIDDGYAGVEQVPKDIRVVRNEINGSGGLRKGLKVEFGIKKNAQDKYSIYSLTMPGGGDVVREEVEERKTAGNSTFSGSVSFYNAKERFGYIQPDSTAKFPPAVKKAIEESNERAEKKFKKDGKKSKEPDSLVYFRRGDVADVDGKIWRGTKADFKLYTDNRGAGAHEVKISA